MLSAPAGDSDSDNDTALSQTRRIILGNNTCIDISLDKIRSLSIPATSFANDIERLNTMWDNTSSHWNEKSVLKIQEQPIALVYWPKVFKGSGLWKSYKSNWTEWKVIQYFSLYIIIDLVFSSSSSVIAKLHQMNFGRNSRRTVKECHTQLSVGLSALTVRKKMPRSLSARGRSTVTISNINSSIVAASTVTTVP